MKSEALKKLEFELKTNQECMDAGLYPPRDKERHLKEIETIKKNIEKEKDRLRIMKESGEIEEYVIPKRNAARQAYSDPHTLPDNDMDTSSGMSDSDTENMDFDLTDADSDTESGTEADAEADLEEEEDNVDGFSDKERFKRFGQASEPDAYWHDRSEN